MYTYYEQKLISKILSAVPPIYREQRDQFARSLFLLAILSVVLEGLLGGWLSSAFFALRSLVVAPASVVGLVLSVFFWLVLLPPLLWAGSILPLRDRRLVGWRLFTLGTVLSFFASILELNLISIIFSAAIIYFTVQCYDEFKWR